MYLSLNNTFHVKYYTRPTPCPQFSPNLSPILSQKIHFKLQTRGGKPPKRKKISDMPGRFEEKLSPDQDSASEAKISRDLQEQLRLSNDSHEIFKEERKEIIDNGEDGEEEEEFSFMCGEGDASPISAEDAFINGKIRPVFPLFNRDLFFSDGELDSLQLESLPSKPLVKKVFVETKDSGEMTSSSTRNDETHGPYCNWSIRKAVEVSPETCKKSNSTGFSKLWRFKELMGRSNSDGSDTFVFLNNGNATPAAAETVVAGVKVEGKVKAVKVKKVGKIKTASLSAHEVYLKRKAREEEKRRSYLPYRSELMGFFTNSNSGLSKNVHPF